MRDPAEPAPVPAIGSRSGVPATPSDTAAGGYGATDALKAGFWSQANEVSGGRG